MTLFLSRWRCLTVIFISKMGTWSFFLDKRATVQHQLQEGSLRSNQLHAKKVIPLSRLGAYYPPYRALPFYKQVQADISAIVDALWLNWNSAILTKMKIFPTRVPGRLYTFVSKEVDRIKDFDATGQGRAFKSGLFKPCSLENAPRHLH